MKITFLLIICFTLSAVCKGQDYVERVEVKLRLIKEDQKSTIALINKRKAELKALSGPVETESIITSLNHQIEKIKQEIVEQKNNVTMLQKQFEAASVTIAPKGEFEKKDDYKQRQVDFRTKLVDAEKKLNNAKENMNAQKDAQKNNLIVLKKKVELRPAEITKDKLYLENEIKRLNNVNYRLTAEIKNISEPKNKGFITDISKYDSELECFDVKIKNVTYKVYVPIDIAPDFKQNYSTIPVLDNTICLAATYNNRSFELLITFIDSRDGQSYCMINIGTQTWMAENLNYRNTDSYCYDDNESNCQKYGRLYKWEFAKNACPSGWHLPSNKEWLQLEMYLGMNQPDGDEIGYRDTNNGEKLKASIGWNDNGNGTDIYGFVALPGGYHNGGFCNSGYGTTFWSTTETSASGAWSRSLGHDYSHVGRDRRNKNHRCSVRCIKD